MGEKWDMVKGAAGEASRLIVKHCTTSRAEARRERALRKRVEAEQQQEAVEAERRQQLARAGQRRQQRLTAKFPRISPRVPRLH